MGRVQLYLFVAVLGMMQVLLLFAGPRSKSDGLVGTAAGDAGHGQNPRQSKEGLQWCPGCRGELCARKFLFIVATGRSGSSTLMNMVNQVPGIFLVEVRGFKEIRWNETMLQFIRRSLPCSRLIFNFRVDEAQSHSNYFKRKQRKPGAEALANITDKAAALVAHSGLPFFQLALENFSAPEFTRLARWLGAECSFDKVYNTNSGGTLDASTTDARCWCPACNATSGCSRRFLFAVLEAPNSTRPAELAEILESLYFSESEELLPGAASLCETVTAMQRLLNTAEQTVGSNVSASDLGKGTAWTHPGPGHLPPTLEKMQKMLWDWLEPPEQPQSAGIRGFAARPLDSPGGLRDLPCLLAISPCARVVVSKEPGGRWKGSKQWILNNLRAWQIPVLDVTSKRDRLPEFLSPGRS
eukprot:s2737_g2.t1